MKKTTKICPDCGNTHLAHMTSMNIKFCTDCGKVIPWYLEKGQEPLLSPPRSSTPTK